MHIPHTGIFRKCKSGHPFSASLFKKQQSRFFLRNKCQIKSTLNIDISQGIDYSLICLYAILSFHILRLSKPFPLFALSNPAARHCRKEAASQILAYFWLSICGLTIIAGVASKSLLKGLISGALGLLLSTIGLDPLTGFSRYSFGVVNLYSGLQTVPLMIGLFAIAQVFMNLKTGVAQNHITQKVTRVLPAREDLKKSLPVSIMCGFIGTFIGIIPAAGADIAAFVSYDVAKKRSKHPEEFGTGCVEGIAAPEAGNNGDTSGALVPMLTLGVPGDATAAVLIGALTLQGLQPGPQLFTEHMDIVNRIFASTLVANFLFLVLGLLGVRLFIKVIQIKPYILTPIIFVLCILGSYALRNNMFDVGAMLLIAVIGYFFLKLEIPIAPIVLALILGPLAESNLRRSLLLSQGSASIFFTRPICIFFLLLAVLSLCWPLLRKVLSNRKKAA